MRKFVSMGSAIGRILEDEQFLERLTEELMLDELLCNEADPKEFLVESIKSCLKDRAIAHHKSRIGILTGGGNQ